MMNRTTASSVDCLAVSDDLKAALKRAGLFTLGRVKEKKRVDVARIKGIGKAGASKIGVALNSYGLSFSQY